MLEDDNALSDSSEGSDFNEDDDPDNIEVPGKLRKGGEYIKTKFTNIVYV